MRNNKGFTVIELAVSFVLVSAICIMLFQLVLSLKDIYVSGDIKTTLLNRQGIMTKKIYDDLNSKDLTSVVSCGLSCLTFSYNDGTTADLIVDPGNNTITYSDYTMKLSDGSKFGQLSTEIDETATALTDSPDSILKISIPVTNKLLDDDDFGIYIVQAYNRSSTTVNNNIALSKTTVIASGVPLKLGVTKNEDQSISGKWVRIFHQESGTAISNKDEFLKSKTETKISSLTSLESFKTKSNLDNVIIEQTSEINSNTELSDTEKTNAIDEMKENYRNGYYHFALDYIGESGSELMNYNEWYQTNNFTKANDLEGVFIVDLIYNSNDTCRFMGLQYNKKEDTTNFVNGCQGNYFNIGSKDGKIYMDTKETSSVDLWVNADEYVSKYALSIIDYNS